MVFSKKSVSMIVLVTVAALAIVIGINLSRVVAKQNSPLIPLRDFFRNPEKAAYQISPDGAYLSFLAPYQSRMNIFVQKIGAHSATRITAVTERDIPSYFWKNNDLLMYTQDNKGDENYHLVGVSKDGLTIKDFTPFEGVKVRLVDSLKDDESHVLIDMNKRDKKVFDVYRLNVMSGQLEMIAENQGNIIRWWTDHDGKLRVAVSSDGVTTSILYRDNESESFRPILTTCWKNEVWPVSFTFDNKQLYIISNINRDKKACVIFDPITQQETKLIFEHPDYDVKFINYSRKRKVLTDVEYISWKYERMYLDSQTETLFKHLEKSLKGYELDVVARNKNEDKFIIRTSSDRKPSSYYLYDLISDVLVKLADSQPWLKEETLAEVKPIKYISRDGLTINGYLTLPLGRESKNLPVVVNPHGGPWARDSWTYNPEIQFLANRGYAVFQMNFRGSTGYGKKFWQLSFKQWGQSMQDDITDGVKWLIDQDIADPQRIAIYGGSYGGYATLAGMTFTPELYACGIDYVGVSNLFTWLATTPKYWKPLLEMMYEMVGHPEKDKELLAHISPVFYVDKIKAPLFIAQGRMDSKVNVKESDQMVAALKKRGLEVEYMVKDNEGHGFNNEENKFEFYEAMEKFLARYLKPYTI